MKRAHFGQAVGFAAVTGLVGLIAGYLVFGRVAGEYLSVSTIFSSGGNVFDRVVRDIAGVEAIRTRILGCGGIGVLAGFALRMFF